MAMADVLGKTQDNWKSFCTWSQMAALEIGSPSAAVVTGAGLARPARSPGLKKQHKARSHLPLTFMFLLPSFQSWREDFVPLLFYLAYSHFSHAHTPLPMRSLRSGRGQKKTYCFKTRGPLRSPHPS